MTKQALLKHTAEKYNNPKDFKNPLFTENTIKTLHQICSQSDTPSKYREQDDLEHLMSHFIGQLNMSHILFHPIEFAVIAYIRILDLRPFESHNEETAAMFLNLLLAQEGYPVIPSPSTMDGYEEALKAAQDKSFPDTDKLLMLIGSYLYHYE